MPSVRWRILAASTYARTRGRYISDLVRMNFHRIHFLLVANVLPTVITHNTRLPRLSKAGYDQPGTSSS